MQHRAKVFEYQICGMYFRRRFTNANLHRDLLDNRFSKERALAAASRRRVLLQCPHGRTGQNACEPTLLVRTSANLIDVTVVELGPRWIETEDFIAFDQTMLGNSCTFDLHMMTAGAAQPFSGPIILTGPIFRVQQGKVGEDALVAERRRDHRAVGVIDPTHKTPATSQDISVAIRFEFTATC